MDIEVASKIGLKYFHSFVFHLKSRKTYIMRPYVGDKIIQIPF